MTTPAARAPLTLPSPAPLAPPEDWPSRLASIGVALAPETVATLGDFLARLLAMNAQMNLTAITTPAEAWTRHILDALTLLPALRALRTGARVVDVGSGGGVPAIPLAIALPELRFTLVEATQKKAWFLTEVSRALRLGNVTVHPERAEVLASGPLARSYDAVTARAVAKLDALLPWTAPLARPGAMLLFIKGARADEELREARKIAARLDCRHHSTTLTSTGRVVRFTVGPA
jgi:16S rRNA (guanine527-N7)-methyltransferase